MTDQTSSLPLRGTVIDTGTTLIVAADRYVRDLHAAAPAQHLPAASILPLAADAPLPTHALANTRVLVLEVDAGNDASMRRMARIRADRPDLAIIAAVEKADISLARTLIRQGVADVTELPFAPKQLQEQILDALAAQAETGMRNLGEAVAVVGSTGGCGATSILTHLAAAIAEKSSGSRGVCLVDLDLQKGSVASYLGIEPVVTMQSLLQAGSRLDLDLMMSAVTDTGRGFSVIASPDSIAPVDHLDIDHLLAILTLARSTFDYVLVDFPPTWTDWSLSLISWTSRVMLLTDPSMAGLRQAKRTIDLLGTVGITSDRMMLVVNRPERRLFGDSRAKLIARAFGSDDVLSVVDAGPSLRAAQDQGLLLPAVQGKTRFATDVAALADRIIDGDMRS